MILTIICNIKITAKYRIIKITIMPLIALLIVKIKITLTKIV